MYFLDFFRCYMKVNKYFISFNILYRIMSVTQSQGKLYARLKSKV